MQYNIPFIQPSFPSASDLGADYEKIVAANWFTNFGQFEQEFSRRSAAYIGAVHATTVANCTLGLEIAIQALFDSRKPQALMPSFTFAAGAEMLIHCGFTPVFVDIEPDSWQLDIRCAEDYLETHKHEVAGILLCNVFGIGNTNVEAWEKLAHGAHIPLVIDSAAGFGSEYVAGQKIGARGDCEVFSLHATKPFAIGEGGLITSKSQELIAKLRRLENFGFGDDKMVHAIGTNAKMQELNCAIALRQLQVFEPRLLRRRKLLKQFKTQLLPHGFTFPSNDELSTVPFVSVAAPTAEDATRLYAKLYDNGIEARHYYHPALHVHKALATRSHRAGLLPVTEDICSRVLSLPLLERFTQADVNYVAGLLLE